MVSLGKESWNGGFSTSTLIHRRVPYRTPFFLESAAINSEADFQSIQFKELFLNTQRPKVQKGIVVVDIVAEKILKPTAESVNMLYEYIDGDT